MKKKRILYFDILNILACFGVVCLHQNGIVHWYDIHTAPFKQSLIFEVGFFWAVPIFFMLSGATYLIIDLAIPQKNFCSGVQNAC